jgi:hypothetical protein
MKSLLRRDDLWELQSFSLRRALDLQFESIWLAMRPYLRRLPTTGTVLDVGAGRSPFRAKFARAWKYVTVDPYCPADYGDLVSDVPAELQADVVLLIEVLEHVPDPSSVLAQLRRHTADEGSLWMTVPFNARVHGAPSDFHRWTPMGLQQLMQRAGWTIETLEPRGTDITTFVSKFIFLCARRLTHPAAAFPAAVSLLAFGPLLLLLAHGCLRWGLGAKDDPLGFFVVARKTRPTP